MFNIEEEKNNKFVNRAHSNHAKHNIPRGTKLNSRRNTHTLMSRFVLVGKKILGTNLSQHLFNFKDNLSDKNFKQNNNKQKCTDVISPKTKQKTRLCKFFLIP